MWAKRFPAVATTMRSLLAVGAASAQDSGGASHAHDERRVQLPPVPQLISLQGFNAASCLLRPEWAWAIAASGLISSQVSKCKLSASDMLAFRGCVSRI